MLKTTGKIGSRPCCISIMPTWITETKKQHLPFTSASKADQINRKPYEDLHIKQSPELVWLIDNISLKGNHSEEVIVLKIMCAWDLVCNHI